MYAYNIICILHTLQKNALKPHRRPAPASPSQRLGKKPPPAQSPPVQLLRTRFSPAQLLEHFRKLLPATQLASWLGLGQKDFYARAFTPLVTLWYLIFQRLCDNHHLSHVVEDALAGGA